MKGTAKIAQIELLDPVRAAVNAADGFCLALFLHLVALLIVFGNLLKTTFFVDIGTFYW